MMTMMIMDNQHWIHITISFTIVSVVVVFFVLDEFSINNLDYCFGWWWWWNKIFNPTSSCDLMIMNFFFALFFAIHSSINHFAYKIINIWSITYLMSCVCMCVCVCDRWTILIIIFIITIIIVSLIVCGFWVHSFWERERKNQIIIEFTKKQKKKFLNQIKYCDCDCDWWKQRIVAHACARHT